MSKGLSLQRMRVIQRVTEDILSNYKFDSYIDLEEIAQNNNVSFYYDTYETRNGKHFDGVLIFQNNKFFLHVNLKFDPDPHSKRNRFSFAHELGHFFLEEHRSIFQKNLKPTRINIITEDIIELEANYFASCILMPQRAFSYVEPSKNFSFDTFIEIAEFFNVSLTAVIIRYSEIGKHPIFVGFYQDGVLKNYRKSGFFSVKYWDFRKKVGESPDPKTVIGEHYLTNSRNTQEEIERVETDAWFISEDIPSHINERIITSKYGTDLSVLWFD